jgi:hypothetical protein
MMVKMSKHVALRIMLAVILALVVVSALIFAMHLGSNHAGSSQHGGQDQEGLPNLSQVDPVVHPALYDFLNSSMGFKTDVDVSHFGMYYAVLVNAGDKPDSNSFQAWVEKYEYGNAFTLPPLGSKPHGIHLEKARLDLVKTYINHMSANRRFVDGKWEIALVSKYQSSDKNANTWDACNTNGLWADIQMEQQVVDDMGNEWQVIYKNGNGWPLEWLKKPAYIQYEYQAGYDMSNKFWNDHPLFSFRVYRNAKGQQLKVEVTQLDQFKLLVNQQTVYLNENQLKNYLEVQGWK